MNPNPLISVIMPVYNNDKYVSYAIESILNQTYKNFEFIIIDDCSTDSSWEIIQQYAKKDKRIKAYKNPENLKIVKTRNKGFLLASKNAKYYAIFDSDDISLLNRLEKEMNFLEQNPNYGLVGSNIFIIDENNKKYAFRKYPYLDKEIKKKILLFSPFAQPSVMIRSKLLKEIGYYDNRYTGIPCEDYDLWLRIINKSKGYNFKEPLIYYRINKNQAKKTHLKVVLKNTIQLQWNWFLKGRFFNLLIPLNLFILICLLMFPSSFVLFLFKKITYKNLK